MHCSLIILNFFQREICFAEKEGQDSEESPQLTQETGNFKLRLNLVPFSVIKREKGGTRAYVLSERTGTHWAPGAGEMAWCLGECTALTEDQTWAPWTHARWFTTSYRGNLLPSSGRYW